MSGVSGLLTQLQILSPTESDQHPEPRMSGEADNHQSTGVTIGNISNLPVIDAKSAR